MAFSFTGWSGPSQEEGSTSTEKFLTTQARITAMDAPSNSASSASGSCITDTDRCSGGTHLLFLETVFLLKLPLRNEY